MRTGHLGPAGTFSHEAVRASGRAEGDELVPYASVHAAIMAVEHGEIDRALVPIENSIEGAITVTLDTLANEAAGVLIAGEEVLPVRHCLIARDDLALDAIEEVVTHPQAGGQCARFLRTRLPGARVLLASSTAEAVRRVAEAGGPRAAIGTELAAELYGALVLARDVEDEPENETRFVWVARTPSADPTGPGKTSVVFWGSGTDAPGWLVRCLSEFAFRGVNLTRIESRPRRQELGEYMFFVDLEGREGDDEVREALTGLATHAEHVRRLGSYPLARG
jgi:prephenate dehydratase